MLFGDITASNVHDGVLVIVVRAGAGTRTGVDDALIRRALAQAHAAVQEMRAAALNAPPKRFGKGAPGPAPAVVAQAARPQPPTRNERTRLWRARALRLV